MNRRIFKKITSHKYIYPTKRIQNIIRHIDESGDTIMYYTKNCYKYWSFILKRIEIPLSMLAKPHRVFKSNESIGLEFAKIRQKTLYFKTENLVKFDDYPFL